ncbi:MAG: beta-ketoacyl synthase N-terminal-like domain-containing protein [Pseudomonadota bacterium]
MSKQDNQGFDSERVMTALREAREQINTLREERDAAIDKVRGDERIAIVGMSARLPGADDIDAFWKLLSESRSGIERLSSQALAQAGVSAAEYDDPNYVPAWASMSNPTHFDADFFGYSPREADLLDPQHRVFLECAWSALEAAGYDPSRYRDRIGVYASAGLNSYLINLYQEHSAGGSVDPLQAVVSNVLGLMPTRVSYHLNLDGPSCGLQSGCSSSLVAIHTACRALLDDDCEMALAGGVTITRATPAGYLFEPGGIASPDGYCRAFDAAGGGTVFGNGAGVVVLKRLSAALADRDHIHAVILSSAINNDGSDKVGLLAPSVSGQAAVIKAALARAQIDAASIDYVEAHGTATELGDPIECKALDLAFGDALRAASKRIRLGSVKTNVGHLDAAAGVAGLIKAVLALENDAIPASLNYTAPNPGIDFTNLPFEVNAEWTAWLRTTAPRRAGVSSFGMGGTNAHVVLEEAPERPVEVNDVPWQLITLSAKTESALDEQTGRVHEALVKLSDDAFADAAYTLQLGREAMPFRRAWLCHDRAEALKVLSRPKLAKEVTNSPDLVFAFPGQGSQYPMMAATLYDRLPVFAEEFDRLASALRGRCDLSKLLFGSTPDPLVETEVVQPALFAVEYALAQVWLDWGAAPVAFIGHSLGEWVAACLAGVFAAEDAIQLVYERGVLMQSCAPGSMLACLCEAGDLIGQLDGSLAIAAINSAQQCVVSGPDDAIAGLAKTLDGAGVGCERLASTRAFHSAAMAPIENEFAKRVAAVRRNPPAIDIASNVTGEWLTAKQAVDPAYWGRQLRETVQFSKGVRLLAELSNPILLEVGPADVLARLARGQVDGLQTVLSMPRADRSSAGLDVLGAALGQLWSHGVEVNWAGVHAGKPRRRIPLPTYPFERAEHYLGVEIAGGKETLGADTSDAAKVGGAQMVGKKNAEKSQWFYVPTWRESPCLAAPTADHDAWLVIAERTTAERLVQRMKLVDPAFVHFGTGYEAGSRRFVIGEERRADFERLRHVLTEREQLPTNIVYVHDPEGALEPALDVIAVAQAFAGLSVALNVVAAGVAPLLPGEAIEPCAASLAGLAEVLPQECPHLDVRLIDSSLENIEGIAQELASPIIHDQRLVARRGVQRWVQDYSSLPLAGVNYEMVPGGVYLIVGDLVDGLGLVFARALREQTGAKLILVGPQHLPPASEWDRWIATHGARHPINETIDVLQRLGREGEDYLLKCVDTCDDDALSAAIAEGVERFGQPRGVFHAGVMGDRATCEFTELNAERYADISGAKSFGIQTLARAIDHFDLDFVMVQSSLSTVVGGQGFAAYASGSAFLDGYAAARTSDETPWFVIDWDACLPAGHESQNKPESQSALTAMALSNDEVWAVTRRVLAQRDFARWVVTPRELSRRRHVGRAIQSLEPAAAARGRPELDTPFVAPRNELEGAVADAMGELLGIDGIGADDDFFDLGGHSLLAIQAVTRLRKIYGVDIPMRALLYGTPTAAGIAEVIQENLAQLDEAALATVESLLEDIEGQLDDQPASPS